MNHAAANTEHVAMSWRKEATSALKAQVWLAQWIRALTAHPAVSISPGLVLGTQQHFCQTNLSTRGRVDVTFCCYVCFGLAVVDSLYPSWQEK